MESTKVFTKTKTQHAEYFSQHKPGDILAALASVGTRLEMKATGATPEKTDEVRAYIIKYKAIGAAILAVKSCATGERKTPFNAFSYMTTGDIEAKLVQGTLDFKSRMLKFTEGLAIAEKMADGNYAKDIKKVSSLDFMMAKATGAACSIINNDQKPVTHTDTILAIPRTIGQYVSVKPESRLGTKKLDAVSDMAVDTFIKQDAKERVARLNSYISEVPVSKTGPVVDVEIKEDKKANIATVTYKYLTPSGAKIAPYAPCVKIIEGKFRNSFPADGLGGRPVLSYFGVPVGATLEQLIYSLTLLKESKVPEDAHIISTETNPVLGAFIQKNGYPNFKCVTETKESAYTMFVSTFIDISADKYVFHPTTIHFMGKKSEEKDEYNKHLRALASRFSVDKAQIIFLTNLSAVLSGGHVHTGTVLADKEQNKKVHDILRKDIGWDPQPYSTNDYEAAGSPDHILSQKEVNTTAVRAAACIGTMKGPSVLISPFLPFNPVVKVLDEMMDAMTSAQALIYGIGHVSKMELNIQLLDKKIEQKIDLDSLGAYTVGAVETFMTEAYNMNKRGEKVALPLDRGRERAKEFLKRAMEKGDGASDDDDHGGAEKEGGDDSDESSQDLTLDKLEEKGTTVIC